MDVRASGSLLVISTRHVSTTQRIMLLNTSNDVIIKSVTYGPAASRSNVFPLVKTLNNDIYIGYIDFLETPDMLKVSKCSVSSLDTCLPIILTNEPITLTFFNISIDPESPVYWNQVFDDPFTFQVSAISLSNPAKPLNNNVNLGMTVTNTSISTLQFTNSSLN